MKEIGNLYQVTDPDGHETVLTCTPQQLNDVWIPQGFKPIEEAASGDVSDKRKTKGSAGSSN